MVAGAASSAIPTALAATSLLLAIAIALGKGEISPTLGSKVGLEIGIYIAIATAAVQTILLGMGLASRHDDRDDYTNELGGNTGRSANR